MLNFPKQPNEKGRARTWIEQLVKPRMRVKLGGRGRAIALRIFSMCQVILAWICLPLSLLITRKQKKLEGRRQLVVISLGGIGDHVLVIPVFKELRHKYPEHQITLVVRLHALGFQNLLPEYIDREMAFPYQDQFWSRLWQPVRAMQFVSRNELRRGTELALIPRWEWDSWGAYFLAFFSRAKRRVSFSESVNYEKKVHNWLFDSLCTEVYEAPAAMSEALKIKNLLSMHESIQIGPVGGSLRSARRRLGTRLEAVHMVLAPVAAHPRRNWPTENWRELIERLHELPTKVRISILGSKSDRKVIDGLVRGRRDAAAFCGLSLGEVVERITEADLFIGADSGMAHLAGAAGVPVIQLFCHPNTGVEGHYNSPTRFAASSPKTIVIQPSANPGCEQACESDSACCIRNIGLDDVLEAVGSQLSLRHVSTVQ